MSSAKKYDVQSSSSIMDFDPNLSEPPLIKLPTLTVEFFFEFLFFDFPHDT